MDIFSRVAIESSAPFNYSFAILGGLDAKASSCNVGDKGSIPGSGRSAGEGNSNPLILLPGKFHGWRSLEDYSPWGCKEVDTTERLHFYFSLSLFTFMHWRRKWQATPVFLPGEPQGWRSLVGCHLWGRIESYTTEATEQQQQQHSIAWKIPRMEENGGLQSMGLQRGRND